MLEGGIIVISERITPVEGLEGVFIIVVRQRMKELHVTRKELADRMCCHISYINHVMNGRKNLSIYSMDRFMRALGVGLEIRFGQPHIPSTS